MGELKRTYYQIRIAGRYGLLRPFSLAVLADLHNRAYHVSMDLLISAILEEKVSAILSAGDLVLAKAGVSCYDEALRLLDILSKEYPIYLVNGNHETRMAGKRYRENYSRYQSALEKLGVIALNNQHISCSIEGMPLGIYGLEIPKACYQGKEDLTADSLRKALGERSSDEYTILLAHHPKFFEAYADWGADLTLAGHLHGGIVRLPKLGGLVSPDFTLFPHYDRGMFERSGKRMLVSAGLGTHTIPVRINNPAELVILEFAPED